MVAATTTRIDDRVAELRREGATTEGFVGDLTHPDTAQALVQTAVDAFGRLDVLVNNAGMVSVSGAEEPTALESTTLEDWRAGMSRNLDTTFLVTRAALPHLPAQTGRIITVSSVSGPVMAYPGDAAYHAAKAATVGLTRSLAIDLADRGITCNAVAPGWIETSSSSEKEVQMGRATPMRRPGRPEEVASLVAFLASRGRRTSPARCSWSTAGTPSPRSGELWWPRDRRRDESQGCAAQGGHRRRRAAGHRPRRHPGLSMRVVAAEAGVPLGTTTYYFKDKDALVAAAFTRHTQRETARVVAAIATFGADLTPSRVASRLADFVITGLTEHRWQLITEYEFLTSAARRDDLQRASTAWLQSLQTHMETTVAALGSPSPRTDARLVLSVVSGLEVDHLGAPLQPAARHAIRRTMAGCSPGWSRRGPRSTPTRRTTDRSRQALCCAELRAELPCSSALGSVRSCLADTPSRMRRPISGSTLSQ